MITPRESTPLRLVPPKPPEQKIRIQLDVSPGLWWILIALILWTVWLKG